MLSDIIMPLYFMLPAFFSNMAAHRFGGGTPVDFGRNFYDGRRIIGDGKTYNGMLGGMVVGTIVGTIQPFIYPSIYNDFPSSLIFGFVIASGAVLGDIIKSFFKRRLGIERGRPFILADQLDFILGGLFFSYTLGRLFLEDFFLLPEEWLAIILLLTPLIHLCGNMIGYKIGVKDVWW